MPTLILLFTRGMSLKEWRRTGMLTRELALYRALLLHYPRILLATYGSADDLEVLHQALPLHEAHRFTLIANTKGLPLDVYAAQLPALIRAALPAEDTVIIKTNQLAGAEVAVSIADHLRASGRTAALIIRGGYHYSAFVAHDQGAGSEQHAAAVEAERTACTRGDLVVGTTQEMLDALVALHGLDAGKTALIPNYVIPHAAAREHATTDQPRFLYAGQLVARKRVDLLIRAFAHWRNNSGHPAAASARLDIHGEGPEASALRELAAQLNAPVNFHGRVPHETLLEAMARCTLYIQPSALEGHPKTVIEAMATGVPVIVADAPGMDPVIDGRTGRKTPATVEALAAAIEELMHNPAERQRLARNASDFARARYGLDAVLSLELAAHQQALSLTPRPQLAAL
jgi:glycosyltransferase involved in cell wall biosynthesis